MSACMFMSDMITPDMITPDSGPGPIGTHLVPKMNEATRGTH